jgi:hypothetical protein
VNDISAYIPAAESSSTLSVTSERYEDDPVERDALAQRLVQRARLDESQHRIDFDRELTQALDERAGIAPTMTPTISYQGRGSGLLSPSLFLATGRTRRPSGSRPLRTACTNDRFTITAPPVTFSESSPR